MQGSMAIVAATAALAPAARAAQAEVPAGCFFYGWKFAPGMTNLSANPIRDVNTAAECQKTCQDIGGCRYFSWETGANACWLADYTMNKFQKSDSFIGGLRECDGVSPLCMATPGSGFPGKTPELSDQAWPTGLVPPKLQCWPRDKDNVFLPCSSEITVLDDSEQGWPGKCMGLDSHPELKDTATCKEECENIPECTVWQMVVEAGSSNCWLGKGTECLKEDRQAVISASQRLMRGSFRVLMDLTGWEVMQLKQEFPAISADTSELGFSMEDAIRECNHTCLAAIECEVWQYSVKSGCMVNDPAFKHMSYPPTRSTFLNGTENGKSVVAGSYIQRLCLSEEDHHAKQGKPPSSAPTPAVSSEHTESKGVLVAAEDSTSTAAETTAAESESTTTATSKTTHTAPTTTTVTSETSVSKVTEVTSTNTTHTRPTTVTTTTGVTVTSTTTLEIITPEKNLRDMFIRGNNPLGVYFRDGESLTKHVVRLEACKRCPDLVKEMCSNPMKVAEGEIAGLPTGEDFECSMFQEGHKVREVEDKVLGMDGQTNPPTPAPTSTLTTTMTGETTLTTTSHVVVAQGGGIPWWVWTLGVVASLCACFGVFTFLSVKKAEAFAKKNKSKRATHISADKMEAGMHDSEDSTSDAGEQASFDAELSEPLVSQKPAPMPPLMAAAPMSGVPGGIPPMSPLGGSFADMDLVTVTPQGLAVTPLNGNAPPAGVPLLQELQRQYGSQPGSPQPGRQYGSQPGSPQRRQNMDLVTVTSQGLAVTPLNGAPPPPGVPYVSAA
jgi:hypothetical protein